MLDVCINIFHGASNNCVEIVPNLFELVYVYYGRGSVYISCILN